MVEIGEGQSGQAKPSEGWQYSKAWPLILASGHPMVRLSEKAKKSVSSSDRVALVFGDTLIYRVPEKIKFILRSALFVGPTGQRFEISAG